MKVKTKIENRFPVRPTHKSQKLVVVLAMLAELGFNTILPFGFGFYFAKTGNLAFLAAFIINLVFSVKITYKNKKINIKIIRGV